MGRPRILFIAGSVNQTQQMHRIASELPECSSWFTPYYGNKLEQFLQSCGLAERTILGSRLRRRCLSYLHEHRLDVDLEGRSHPYDLAVTCSDVVVQDNIRDLPLVAVQEGIVDPDGWLSLVVRRFGHLPSWVAGTATTGLSGAYRYFCVASPGYRDWFVERGAPADRVIATGIPNFDDCESFRDNDFPRRDYVLVCTSDTRETLKFDWRRRFIRRAVRIAAGRELIFRLHPNEDAGRAAREIHAVAPDALVFRDGPTEAMVANCEVLITQYSSVVFVGLALHKQVYSYFPLEQLQRLLPVQNRSAAKNIAGICRRVLDSQPLARSLPVVSEAFA